MQEYLKALTAILISFLGEPKNEISKDTQLQFSCPRCIEEKGIGEKNKYNLEVNLRLGLFHCWSCGQSHEDMQGSIKKLIRMYGTKDDYRHYKEIIYEMKSSSLYKLHFDENDFNIEYGSATVKEVELPPNFKKLTTTQYTKKALKYLLDRGIGWDIINDFHIGFTKYDENNKQVSSRIVIPSFNKYGELNYWTGRDFTSLDKRQKYFNPKVERKNLIFNEEKINWDCDITLVEGPFDSIVVPNSVPLLGKVLTTDFKLYQELVTKANANINIFLDGDAYEDVKKIYKLLNHNKLYNRIRYIPLTEELDPSLIYQYWGKKGIIHFLRGAKKIKEVELL